MPGTTVLQRFKQNGEQLRRGAMLANCRVVRSKACDTIYHQTAATNGANNTGIPHGEYPIDGAALRRVGDERRDVDTDE